MNSKEGPEKRNGDVI